MTPLMAIPANAGTIYNASTSSFLSFVMDVIENTFPRSYFVHSVRFQAPHTLNYDLNAIAARHQVSFICSGRKFTHIPRLFIIYKARLSITIFHPYCG